MSCSTQQGNSITKTYDFFKKFRHIKIINNLKINHKIIFFQLKNARGFQSSAAVCSDHLFVHRDTPEDNPNIKFEFTPENQKVNAVFHQPFISF